MSGDGVDSKFKLLIIVVHGDWCTVHVLRTPSESHIGFQRVLPLDTREGHWRHCLKHNSPDQLVFLDHLFFLLIGELSVSGSGSKINTTLNMSPLIVANTLKLGIIHITRKVTLLSYKK